MSDYFRSRRLVNGNLLRSNYRRLRYFIINNSDGVIHPGTDSILGEVPLLGVVYDGKGLFFVGTNWQRWEIIENFLFYFGEYGKKVQIFKKKVLET